MAAWTEAIASRCVCVCGDGSGEDELGRVVDDVAGLPRPAAGGFKLEEIHLPDAVAAGGQLDERLAAPGGEIAALGDVVDRQRQAGLAQDPQAS